MRRLALVLAIAALAGAAHAQQGPQVNVSIGPALQARADDFGPRELADLSNDLRDEVTHALAHSRFAPARVDLMIEDATPNRPTFAQLGRSVGLSMRSIGVGGARISGMIVGPDGASRPIRYQYYETDLREERGASTWDDADRTFMQLADQLAAGKAPDKFFGPGPERNGGHFGYPYTGD